MERIDLLRFIHKALRHAILTTNLESGRIDYTDADATKRMEEAWNLVRENLAHHAHHEDEVIFPLLDARAPGETSALKQDHQTIQAFEAEIGDLIERVNLESSAELRRVLGSEFHRALQRYTALCLSHFDDEERHLMPRLWALYSDGELEAAFGRIMAMIEPEERAYTMVHMNEALDPVELGALRERIGAA